MAAAQHVFALPELVEEIILYLPVADVLAMASRLCRKWNAVIHGSTQIQQNLFLKASKPVVKPAEYSPRLCFGPHYHEMLQLNPILKSDVITWANAGEARMRGGWLQEVIVSGWRGEARAGSLPQGVHQAHASWRRMFATAPPCSEMQVELQKVSNEDGDSDETMRWVAVRDQAGVKLDMLEDAAVGLMMDWHGRRSRLFGRRSSMNGPVSCYFKFYMSADIQS